jgi:hypothetical protein
MTKLYGLVQAGGFCFSLLGVVAGIRVNDVEKIREVEARLPWGHRRHGICSVKRLYSFYFNRRETRPGMRRYHTLYRDSDVLARTENETELLDEFERDLGLHIAQSTPKRLVVHAGVVDWKGTAIVMPGRSFTGKTTLVKEFLRHGATYYSDEYAILDRNGRVHPYPRPLMVRDSANGRQREVATSTLGCRVGAKPIRIGLILVTFYRRSARWRPRPQSVTHGALGLLANSFSGRRDPVKALTFISEAVSKARVLSGVRGEAAEMVQAILRGLEGSGRNRGERSFAAK